MLTKMETDLNTSCLKLDDTIGKIHVPHYLTGMEIKKFFYSLDSYFREGLEDAQEIFDEDFEKISLSTAAVTFKPDAIVNRKIDPTLKFLVGKGFVPIAFAPFLYNEFIVREDWRYQYNVATRNRKRIVDYLLKTGASLMVIFSKKPGNFSNSCEEITSFKGHSELALRSSENLRYKLNSINSLLNYIHTCDEPADFYRSLGLYFNEESRKQLLKKIKAGNPCENELSACIEKLHRQHEAIDFDLDKIIEKIIAKAEFFEEEQRNKIIRICEQMPQIDEEQWHLLYQTFVGKEEELLNRWEVIVLLTSCVKTSIKNKKAIIN